MVRKAAAMAHIDATSQNPDEREDD